MVLVLYILVQNADKGGSKIPNNLADVISERPPRSSQLIQPSKVSNADLFLMDERQNEKRSGSGTPYTLRGQVHMTSAKFSYFWAPIARILDRLIVLNPRNPREQ